MAKVFLKSSDPDLLKTAKKIPESKISSKETTKIIQKMIKIASGEQGNADKPIMVGLAAPQIGISKRIILVDLKADGKGTVGDLRVFINPQITYFSKKENAWYEGCYSLPGICGIVKRPTTIKVKAFTDHGQIWEDKVSGYVARIFQHEIDHLDGKLFSSLITNPNHLHKVKAEEFRLYRNRQAWRNWPKKQPLPLASLRLENV